MESPDDKPQDSTTASKKTDENDEDTRSEPDDSSTVSNVEHDGAARKSLQASVSPKSTENINEINAASKEDCRELEIQNQDIFEEVEENEEGKSSHSTRIEDQQHSLETNENDSQEPSIPGDLLSPPKSEPQTDETITSISSSSPDSVTQLSPTSMGEGPISGTARTQKETPERSRAESPASGCGDQSPSTDHPTTNGKITKPEKSHRHGINKKLSKPKSSKQKKSKALVAMYESEISDNKIGIKLCIKKADCSSMPPKGKTSRKRSRKSKTYVDGNDSEYETKRRRDKTTNNNPDRQNRLDEQEEQSVWATHLPENVLFLVFQHLVDKDGVIPTLFRLGRVCSLWRRVSLSSSLWKTIDLSEGIKDKHRTELRLKWFLENRAKACTHLNVSNWKVTDIPCFLSKLSACCPNLTGIVFKEWKNLTSDHLSYLVDHIPKLARLDLSSINAEMNASKSAVGLQSLCRSLQIMNGRLTHLYLAHNRLAGIPQIVKILATYCPNLELLDLSNVRTAATSHGILPLEKLQHGCRKLKVLRITNSQINLSHASLQETLDSPGFPELEELSVAITSEARTIGDEHLQRILKTSSKLSLLDLRGCLRLTHESLIRLPAWDLKHLFLSGCSLTREGSGLELIASKWAHSLIEIDLAWANVELPLDNALRVLAEKGKDSPLSYLNLCGSSVSEDAVRDILANCPKLYSINLSSCRGLPRGIKRVMHGPTQIQELRDVLKVQMKVKLPPQMDLQVIKSERIEN